MRVLVAEDEPDLREALRKGLVREGDAVDAVGTGPDAVRRCTARRHDLVVLDLSLPGLDGIGVCRSVRATDEPPLVLMLTARDGIEDRIAGLDSGADDYQDASGTGLGLAIVCELVDAADGEVDLDAGTGSGTIATVRLPAPASVPGEDRAVAPQQVGVPPGPVADPAGAPSR